MELKMNDGEEIETECQLSFSRKMVVSNKGRGIMIGVYPDGSDID
jgi:hypothetical protein